MQTPHVYFSHGKESGPWGSKIKALAKIAERNGADVTSIDYTNEDDPEARIQMLINACHGTDPGKIILAGSSMGGYVSAAAAEEISPAGLFLMAPALFIEGYPREDFSVNSPEICIVHGWNDELIPPENPTRFAQKHKADLHLLNARHRLAEVRPRLENIFENFLKRCLTSP